MLDMIDLGVFHVCVTLLCHLDKDEVGPGLRTRRPGPDGGGVRVGKGYRSPRRSSKPLTLDRVGVGPKG